MNGTEKWFTVDEYIDIETGEIITKSLYEREYYMIKKEIKFETDGIIKIKKQQKICRRTGQLTIFGNSKTN